MFPVYGLIAPLYEPLHDLVRARWERGIVSGLLLGPGTPSGAAAFGLLLATLCVTLAVLGASRRQVR